MGNLFQPFWHPIDGLPLLKWLFNLCEHSHRVLELAAAAESLFSGVYQIFHNVFEPCSSYDALFSRASAMAASYTGLSSQSSPFGG
ncbi:hypothetical protein VNO77_10799 [Canavalia gladiata]|uniref:Uncharacterized protein n=1 Tax=Canavalia gladiata TaxID=3824 RepID=A0AAN9MG83_CANGL